MRMEVEIVSRIVIYRSRITKNQELTNDHNDSHDNKERKRVMVGRVFDTVEAARAACEEDIARLKMGASDWAGIYLLPQSGYMYWLGEGHDVVPCPEGE